MPSKATVGSSHKSSFRDDRPKNDFYNIANLTRFGPSSIPGYRIACNKADSRRISFNTTPGPGAYYPENYRPLGPRPPAFSLASRGDQPLYHTKDKFPAPNEYQKTVCLSPECAEKPVGKSFGIRWPERKKTLTSEVPFYSLSNLDATRTTAPRFKMADPVSVRRHVGQTSPPSPGPSSYFPEPKRDPRAFSFGSKYSGAVTALKSDCEYDWV